MCWLACPFMVHTASWYQVTRCVVNPPLRSIQIQRPSKIELSQLQRSRPCTERVTGPAHMQRVRGNLGVTHHHFQLSSIVGNVRRSVTISAASIFIQKKNKLSVATVTAFHRDTINLWRTFFRQKIKSARMPAAAPCMWR